MDANWISGCIAGVVMFGVLVGGVTSCAVIDSQQQTKRVEAACTGNLSSDAARSAACTLALAKTRMAGN
jgi:hypothetical protein